MISVILITLSSALLICQRIQLMEDEKVVLRSLPVPLRVLEAPQGEVV